MRRQRDTKELRSSEEVGTELVPPSEASSGEELDPGCNDQDIPASPITMMSPAGERNARQAGNVVNWRIGTLRGQP